MIQIFISDLIDQILGGGQNHGASASQNDPSGASASNGDTPGAHGTEGARRRKPAQESESAASNEPVEKNYTQEQLEQVRKLVPASFTSLNIFSLSLFFSF